MNTNANHLYREAFSGASVYVVLGDGYRVGNIYFSLPGKHDGLMNCFLAFHGLDMVAGSAYGGAVGKQERAFAEACSKITTPYNKDVERILGAVGGANGDFVSAIRQAGYVVWEII